MDLGFTAEEEVFREEVRTWLDLNLPAEWRNGGVGGYREDADESMQRQWQQRLHEGGWLKLSWPRRAASRGCLTLRSAKRVRPRSGSRPPRCAASNEPTARCR